MRVMPPFSASRRKYQQSQNSQSLKWLNPIQNRQSFPLDNNSAHKMTLRPDYSSNYLLTLRAIQQNFDLMSQAV